MRASFNGSGYPATNRETWRFKSSRPRHFPARRPRDRAQPSEGWNSGSTPDGPANFLRSVGRLARYPAVYRVEASSILVRSAKVRGDVDKLAKSPVFQAGHRGFESRHRYHWPEAHEDEQSGHPGSAHNGSVGLCAGPSGSELESRQVNQAL